MQYVVNRELQVNASLTGFHFTPDDVLRSVLVTNETIAGAGCEFLLKLMTPTLTTAIGDVFQSAFISETGTVMNPYRNGRPDVLPVSALQSPRDQLRDYPCGIELKTTSGSIPGGESPYGKSRLSELTGLTFATGKAKHAPILAVVWDFVAQMPTMTAVFYSQLDSTDWAELSGHGSVAKASGRRKLAKGYIVLTDDATYKMRYMELMGHKNGVELFPWAAQ